MWPITIPASRAPTPTDFSRRNRSRISVDSQEPQLVSFLYNIGGDPAMIRVSELELSPQDQNRYRLRGTITLIANYAKRTPTRSARRAGKPRPYRAQNPEARLGQ